MSGKIYVVVLCGAGDRPIAELGGRTPLEFAVTPNLDALAVSGATGLIRVIDETITPESDSGAMALLGYDPLRYYTGRGPLEGLGIGFLGIDDTAAAFRINFASYNVDAGRLDRRTARDLTDLELQLLVQEIRRDVTLADLDGTFFHVVAFGRHRGIACFRSPTRPLSGEVSNTDPGFRRVGTFGVPNDRHAGQPLDARALDETPAAAFSAHVVNEFVRRSARVLQASPVNRARIAAGKLPANLLLFRDGGHRIPDLPSFRTRFGLTVTVYGQVPAERGLCRLIGARWVEARCGQSESEEHFYLGLLERLVNDPSDVRFVHLKGPDEPGHDNRPRDKVRAIEAIDRVFVAGLRRHVRPDDLVVITSDHATPCDLGIHATDAVATLVAGGRVRPDDTTAFFERAAARGGLPLRHAVDVMPFLQAHTAATGPA